MNGRPWTRKESALLRKLYPNHRIDDLVRMMGGRSLQSINGQASTLGLKKSKKYWASGKAYEGFGQSPAFVASRFKPGDPRSGKYGAAFIRAGKKTRFKKGDIPPNHKPVGSRRIVDGYEYTKIRECDGHPWTWAWRQSHYILWEKHRGSIPKRHVVAFKDGNRSHIKMKNLELRSMRENMRRNTIQRYPESLRTTMQLLGKVKAKIRRRREEQN